ncbi:hypothetical protein [Dendronalium sp. ChiSLP03b]|nr:hypothetical protein [Dendronalium sp. ChiSLP03b]
MYSRPEAINQYTFRALYCFLWGIGSGIVHISSASVRSYQGSCDRLL